MKFAVVLFLLLLPAQVFASPFAESKIKKCMASIYSAQSLYKNQHRQYTTFAAELGVYDNTACERLRISIKLEKKGFKALVAGRGTMWVVDSKRNMRRLSRN
jgi:hypothetical protein